jgi:hypothetical protein
MAFASPLQTWAVPTGPELRLFKDPLILVLSGLLAVTLLAFCLGIIPYPYGILVILVFLLSRILFKT